MFLGIDIGGTNIKTELVAEDGALLWQQSQPTGAERGKDAVIADVQEIILQAQKQYPTLCSVGIGFPSVVHPNSGYVYYPPNMPGWGEVPLRDILRTVTSLPIAIDNDANVAALAECELGAGQDAPHFLYVTLGTGVGGGIIVGGEIFSGERGGAGEIGHVIVDAFDEPTEVQQQQGRSFRAGVMEEYVGRAGILASAYSLMHRYPDSLLHGIVREQGDAFDVHHISLAAEQGDTAALECIIRTGKILGAALSSVLNILDMRLVIIGGGISQMHPLLLETVHHTLRHRTLPTIASEVKVRKAHFSYQAGMVGAAMLGKRLWLRGRTTETA